MVVIRVLAAAFAAAGLVLLGFGLNAFLERREFTARAARADGVVTEVIKTRTGRRSSAVRYSYRVRYQAGPAASVETLAGGWHSHPEYQVGEAVPLLYNPARPQEAAVNSFSLLWFNTGLLLALGGSLLGAGLCNLWITAVPAKKGIRTEASLRELREGWRSGTVSRDSEYQGLLVALTFVGFALLGTAAMFVLFASATVKIVIGVLLLYMLIQAGRGRRRRARTVRPAR